MPRRRCRATPTCPPGAIGRRRSSSAVAAALLFASAGLPVPALAEEGADGAVTGSPTLPPVLVTSQRDYAVQDVAAGSRLPLALRDVPQSVTAIDASLLADLAPHTLDEVADYVAGVDREGALAGPYTVSFFFRGFNTGGAASTLNGFREFGFQTPQSAANIERIEFLKGPASVLYGGSFALSGLVNVVTKRPSATPAQQFVLGGGSHDRAYAELDATGPLTDGGTLRYRLTAAYDEGGSFVRDYSQRSVFVSPYLSWDITPSTTLDVELIGQDVRADGRRNSFFRDPLFFELPVESNFGPGGDSRDERRLARVDLTHRFANDWRLRQGLFYQDVDTPYDRGFQVLFEVNADGRTGPRRVRSVTGFQRDRALQTELSGTFSTGRLEHQLLVGFEYARYLFGYAFFEAPYSDVDFLAPAPGEQLGPLEPDYPAEEYGATTRALYVQDLVDLRGGFKALLGVRYDDADTVYRPQDRGEPVYNEQSDRAVSPRVGLIWQPSATTSVYTSWATSFSPNFFGRSATGEPFEPERGRQVEVGARHELAAGLQLSAAVFEYRRRNILTTDPNDPTQSSSITVGEQRSRGVELEALGRIGDDWQLFASYAFLDATVTRDNSLPVGDRLTGVPRHSVGLFNRVRLAALGAPRLSATLGIAWAGARESGLPNDPDGDGPLTGADVELPEYTKIDAGLIYDADRFTLRLTGSNLLDEKIYDGYYSTFAPRAGRTFAASVTVPF